MSAVYTTSININKHNTDDTQVTGMIISNEMTHFISSTL